MSIFLMAEAVLRSVSTVGQKEGRLGGWCGGLSLCGVCSRSSL